MVEYALYVLARRIKTAFMALQAVYAKVDPPSSPPGGYISSFMPQYGLNTVPPKMPTNKSQRNARRNNRRTRRNRRSGNTRTTTRTSAPRPTFNVDRPQYNPTWNPQYFKVARTFQYSTTAADQAGGYAAIVDPSVTCSTTVHAYSSGALAFGIDQVPNVSEFGALFDQYRIAAVKLHWDFMSSTQAVAPITSSPSQRFTLLLYEDYDDGTPPPASNSGFAAVFESGRAKKAVFPSSKNSLTYVIRPKYLVADIDYTGATGGRSLGSGWVDGASTTIFWRGIKWIAQSNPSPVTNTGTWRITATFYTEWRNRQ